MKTSSAAHQEHIGHFLCTLRIRRRTVPSYCSVLRRFQRMTLDGRAGKPLSMRVLCRWAKRQRHSPLYMIHSRARLIDRFLRWMTERGLLDRNPFEHLRRQYHLHSMTPIVEALLSKHPEQVLHRRRGCAPFGSFLGPQMRAHIARMRVLGYRYRTEEAAFLRFDRFLQTRPDLQGRVEGARGGLGSNAGQSAARVRSSAVRTLVVEIAASA